MRRRQRSSRNDHQPLILLSPPPDEKPAQSSAYNIRRIIHLALDRTIDEIRARVTWPRLLRQSLVKAVLFLFRIGCRCNVIIHSEAPFIRDSQHNGTLLLWHIPLLPSSRSWAIDRSRLCHPRLVTFWMRFPIHLRHALAMHFDGSLTMSHPILTVVDKSPYKYVLYVCSSSTFYMRAPVRLAYFVYAKWTLFNTY